MTLLSSLLWITPALTFILGLSLWRLSISVAAALALLVTCVLAMTASPEIYSWAQLGEANLRGAWIGSTIAPYIFGGVLFWQAAYGGQRKAAAPSAPVPKAQRRLLFFACFLIGPFAEAATGFGVGMIGTLFILRQLNLRPMQMAVLSLLSQTFIPWGAMGSGTVLASTYARLPAAELIWYSALPVALLFLVWLPLYWRIARQAGLQCTAGEAAQELVWLVAAISLLALSSAKLGPETALLATYGSLITLRFYLDARPGLTQCLASAKRALPFALLILTLMLSRLLTPLQEQLQTWGQLRPFADLPAFSPWYHAGSLLLLGALLCYLLQRRSQEIPGQLKRSWHSSRQSILSILFFAMMAEVLTGTGVSQALAQGLLHTFGSEALMPGLLLSSLLGVLTNSGNMPNSLFMSSQVALAGQAHLNLALIAALQHASGTCMSLFSPIRIAMACALTEQSGQERRLYQIMLPYAGAAMLLLLGLAWLCTR